MKKTICLVVVLMMIAAVAIAAQKVAITTKNVASLKGIWAGTIAFGITTGGGTSPCTLEIYNDTPPLRAKLTISNLPDQVAMQFGESPGRKFMESEEGIITSAGTVMWAGAGKNFVEVTLLDNNKLSAWYYWKGMRGDMTLTKK